MDKHLLPLSVKAIMPVTVSYQYSFGVKKTSGAFYISRKRGSERSAYKKWICIVMVVNFRLRRRKAEADISAISPRQGESTQSPQGF